MNGSARFTRSRARIAGLALVVVLAMPALFASTASASVPITSTQLSLGDSLAFGYSQQLLNEHLLEGDPAKAFEHGYANFYFNAHKPKMNGIQLVNDGCPGETTDSMIGNGALGAVLDPTEGEAPCVYHNVTKLPLHHEYQAGQSQLENAIETLTLTTLGGQPVNTITLNIGANDELHAIGKCEAEVAHEFETEGKSKYGATPEAAVKGCIEAHVKGLVEHLLRNIGSIVFALRHYGTFAAAATGKPELATLEYTGKIVFLESYDPYGNVFGKGELLAGSAALAGLINGEETHFLTDEGEEALKEGHEAFHVCPTNPLPVFNTGKKTEPTNLQKWTNMANMTVFTIFGHEIHYGEKNVEVAPGVKVNADGPDIHPTPEGYKKLSKLMLLACE
jgi:hypothetical protein